MGTSTAVIGLYIAFAMPIILRIRVGERFSPGAWSLGRHYRWIAPLAVGWIGVVCVLFLLSVSPKGVPGADEFDRNVVNYAPLTVGGVVLLFGGWYLLSAPAGSPGRFRRRAPRRSSRRSNRSWSTTDGELL